MIFSCLLHPEDAVKLFLDLCKVSEAHPEVGTIQFSLLLADVLAAHVSYFLFKVSRVVVRGFFQINVPFYNVS